ncbi:MAG: hypothetical protein IKA30_01980 [Alphaproteobacteria bacterium]|nr:hypothetical protein [Alphaproteobacteria bacterium]
MRQLIEKSAFDWSKGKDKRILAKGVAAIAMLSHRIDANGNIISTGSTRCVWDNLQYKSENRYLKRRVWVG